MLELLTIIPVTVAAFGATNLDNLVLLVALLARHPARRALVLNGYAGAMLILIGVSFGLGKAAELIPVSYLGYLGVVPLGMGVAGLAKLGSKRAIGTDEPAPPPAASGTVLAGTALTQLSNGSDTLVTFSVLLADSSPAADLLILATFAGLVVLFCLLAMHAVGHPRLGAILHRAGRYLTPLILIFVGVYILSDTVTDNPGDQFVSLQTSEMA
jgi:cadmium resistance protein CadD (predicted permease)